MRCGVSKAFITPPAGCWLQGYGSRDHGAEGVLDDLTAHAAVFEDAGRRVALVSADILCFGLRSVQRIRAEVRRRTGISEGSVLLAASHTHAGPAVGDLRGMGAAPSEYVAEMEHRIGDAVAQACETAKEVDLGIGSIDVDGASIVREGKDRDKMPEEKELKVMCITPAGDGRPSCVLYNFACHAVTLGSGNYRFSADYPGEVRRLMKQKSAADIFFFQGACGDINPAACRWDDPQRPALGTEEMERLGGLMAVKLEAVLEGIEGIPAAGLASVDLRVEIPAADPKDEILQAALREAEACSAASVTSTAESQRLAVVRTEWAKSLWERLESGCYPKHIDVPVQLVRIGDALFVGIGAELFSGVGLDIKEGLGRGNAFVSAYTNGCVGYIASVESYDTSEYAVRGSAAFYGIPVLAREAGAVLTEEILKAAASLGQP